MSDLKICRICVCTEVKMYHINQYRLHLYYEEIVNIKNEEQDGLPVHFCYECAAILHKFHKFKEKCYKGQKVLHNILRDGPITYESVNKIDREGTILNSTLSMVTIHDGSEEDQELNTYVKPEDTTNEGDMETVDIDCKSELSFSDKDESQEVFEEEMSIEDEKIETEEVNKLDTECENGVLKEESNRKEFDNKVNSNEKEVRKDQVDSNKKEVRKNQVDSNKKEVRKSQVDTNKKEKKSTRKKGSKNFEIVNALNDESKWKKSVLSEEDAMKEFKAKADDSKYLAAEYKCKDCFKGFSKKNMLDTHIKLRHIEELGSIVCIFCKYRYKMSCFLNKHAKQHYTRYECMRCSLVCNLENSAILHEEYHSGITKKCHYCGDEFRHSSTYYSHLRTHRSEHVCTLCGASFVSKLGLKQHKQIKHVFMDIESPDDDEEVNTYCDKCDIRFDTRKAYEEHLFHSALHCEDDCYKNDDLNIDVNDEKSDDESSDSQGRNEVRHDKIAKARKVLAKKQQAKITKAIRKPGVEHPLDILSVVAGRKRKKTSRERIRRKPTTCHQCGKHFSTQAACMKHHYEAHPRTPFHPPSQRYICEICGASLAPGSIAVHQNIHSREKVHTCDTCGRQFHAQIGLKRHMLTHTGEKPYGCPLCEKKFTQSNSMKLHYKTFHLKQPYPKRNRRPWTKEPKTSDPRKSNDENSSSSLDSLPDVKTRSKSRKKKPVTAAVEGKPDDSVNYMTLT